MVLEALRSSSTEQEQLLIRPTMCAGAVALRHIETGKPPVEQRKSDLLGVSDFLKGRLGQLRYQAYAQARVVAIAREALKVSAETNDESVRAMLDTTAATCNLLAAEKAPDETQLKLASFVINSFLAYSAIPAISETPE